ncbi:MAG: T9SS type A sorting domain-containing protein [Taibaiella sp.]|nr:T9SS type A sorting domain-containing protein [Taibaiella sp.]
MTPTSPAVISYDPSDLYVWAWSNTNVGTGGCGIGWKRTVIGDPTNIVDDGFLVLDKHVYYPEVAFIRGNDQLFYIVLAYYRSRDYHDIGVSGHFYDIYRWESTGITPVSVNVPLSSEIAPRRISIDAHLNYGLVMAWETSEGLRVKAMQSGGINLTIGPILPVTSAPTGLDPDVAFSHEGSSPDDLHVRLLYCVPSLGTTAEYTISWRNFYDLFTGTGVAFFLDYFTTLNYTPSSHFTGNVMHHLDCPDHSLLKRWAFTYYNSFLDRVQLFNWNPGTSSVLNTDITGAYFTAADWSFGSNTLAYDKETNLIHVGFFAYKSPSSTSLMPTGFAAVTYFETGTKLGVPNEFKVINNTPYTPWGSSISFSKQNDNTNQVFISYPARIGVSSVAEVRHKHAMVPTAYGNMSAGVNIDEQTGFTAQVVPNPIGEQFELRVKGDLFYQYDAVLTDISGKTISNCSGRLTEISSQLSFETRALPAGMYFINLTQYKGSDVQRTQIKLVKN